MHNQDRTDALELYLSLDVAHATACRGGDDNLCEELYAQANDAWHSFTEFPSTTAQEQVEYALVAGLLFEGLESVKADEILERSLAFVSPPVVAWARLRIGEQVSNIC